MILIEFHDATNQDGDKRVAIDPMTVRRVRPCEGDEFTPEGVRTIVEYQLHKDRVERLHLAEKYELVVDRIQTAALHRQDALGVSV